jgi:nitrogen fixation/metabolism regulation signal transduction histidine kinase
MLKQNNKIINKETKSLALDLESLTTRYRTLLIEYRQANANYVDYLNNGSDLSMNSLKGAAYWGTSGLSQLTSKNLQECKALCANTTNCTGATYNPSFNGVKKCWLRTGDANIVPGNTNDYAIVPKGKQLLKIVQDLNSKLTNVNKQIQRQSKSFNKIYNNQVSERSLNTSELKNQHVKLMEERNRIKKMLVEYQALDEQQKEGDISISQNYYSFILLLLFVIVFIFILYKYSIKV